MKDFQTFLDTCADVTGGDDTLIKTIVENLKTDSISSEDLQSVLSAAQDVAIDASIALLRSYHEWLG